MWMKTKKMPPSSTDTTAKVTANNHGGISLLWFLTVWILQRLQCCEHDLCCLTASGKIPRTQSKTVHSFVNLAEASVTVSFKCLCKTTKLGRPEHFITFTWRCHDGMQAQIHGNDSEPFEVSTMGDNIAVKLFNLHRLQDKGLNHQPYTWCSKEMWAVWQPHLQLHLLTVALSLFTEPTIYLHSLSLLILCKDRWLRIGLCQPPLHTVHWMKGSSSSSSIMKDKGLMVLALTAVLHHQFQHSAAFSAA